MSEETNNAWYLMVIDGFDEPAFINNPEGIGPCFAQGPDNVQAWVERFAEDNLTRTSRDQIKPVEIGPELNGRKFKYYMNKALKRNESISVFVFEDQKIGKIVLPDQVIKSLSHSKRRKRVLARNLSKGPIVHKKLPDDLVKRIVSLKNIFSDVVPDPINDWIEDFRRDHNPENEVVIWEAMAKEYQRGLTLFENPTKQDKVELFGQIMKRSLVCSPVKIK